MATFSMTKLKFINQWLRQFATGLSKKDYEAYVKDQYIWHVFSFPLLKYSNLLTGDAARKAFDAIEKATSICCDLFGTDGVKDALPSDGQTAALIDAHYNELYVVDKDYTWTYIKTHEGDLCGPYF